MNELLRDLRHAARALRRTPSATAIIVLTLALGIGANVAIFSVIHGVVLEPLEYPQPGELVLVTSQFPTLGFDRFWVSPPEYMEYREWNTSFTDLGGYRVGEASVVGSEQPLRVRAGSVTAPFFRVMGVEPLLGRTFTEEEDLPGVSPVVVLSHELWQGALGGDESWVGRSLEVNGQPSTVIGVMPPGFDIEEERVQVWVPVGLDPANRQNRGSHFLYLVGRLRPGIDLVAARGELETLISSWKERIGGDTHVPHPEFHRLQLEPLHEAVVGDTRPALLALLGAVAFVLLIACANVANLMLARSEARQKELAVRSSMGATRWRLVRLVLLESVLLALIGAALGVAIAQLGLRALLAASPDSLPRTDDVTLDPVVLAFALLLALGTGLLFGLAPALQIRVPRLFSMLKEGALRASSAGSGLWLRRSLVVAEMALAVGLVVGSGLMLRSLDRLLGVDPGFDPEGLVTFRLFLPSSGYPDGVATTGFFDRLFASLAEVPGVESVAAASGLPPQRDVNANDMEFEGVERGEDGPPHNIDYWQFASAGYLETMGIGLLDGRGFALSDDAESPLVALVNRRAAETWWPDQSPLGRRMRPGGGSGDRPWFTIVGVVEDVKQQGLDREAGTEAYFLQSQVSAVGLVLRRTMNVLIRTELPLASVGDELRRRVWAIDPTLPVASLQTMDDVFGASIARARFLTLLISIFGALALLLAAIGIYGVMSYAVAERARELGIRMAGGAQRRRILSLVMGQGLVLAVVGLAVGVAAAVGLSRLLATLLFGVGTTDPATYAAVLALLGLVALAACALPALRATRVDPLAVLRSE
ncbi:MAG TPA: ABC transporter permease [Thermoanaerobaculia bacterium]|nr:ABC transporter permease [Thermoanaerobaculia bacterium]